MLSAQDYINTINFLNRTELKGYEEASVLVGLVNKLRQQAQMAAQPSPAVPVETPVDEK